MAIYTSPDANAMVGRKVRSNWYQMEGVIIRWEPLMPGALCDILVRRADGSECWYSSHAMIVPADGLGPLPSCDTVREMARAQQIASLEKCRADLIREWHKPWPGAEHGKAIIGRIIDGALASLAHEEG